MRPVLRLPQPLQVPIPASPYVRHSDDGTSICWNCGYRYPAVHTPVCAYCGYGFPKVAKVVKAA